MITYTIPNNIKEPIYQYLYECIAQDIKTGKLKADEKLPSKRLLSEQLQVSVITIENTYSQLMSEGYIYAIEKKGYYVSKIDVLNIQNKRKEKHVIEKEKKYIVDLTTSSNNTSMFPFSSYSKIVRKILSEKKKETLSESPYQGIKELRASIAKHLNDYLGIEVDDEQIIVGSGSEQLYSLLVQFFGKERKYALEDPGYSSIANVYKRNEVNYSYINLDENGINVNNLKKTKANIVHVSTNHHFPTGITMPISRRYELLKWAKENDGVIIEDDYDSELRLKGKPIPPLFNLDNNRVIYLNTFSLTLSSSFRLAYMILPTNMVKEYREKMQFYKCTVPTLDQLVLNEFISSKNFERHLNRMKKYYRDIRNEFIDELKKCDVINHLELKEADSGLHLLLKHNLKISDAKLKEKAEKLKFKIIMLSDFMSKPSDSKTILIRYVSLDKTNIVKTCDLLNKLIKSSS